MTGEQGRGRREAREGAGSGSRKKDGECDWPPATDPRGCEVLCARSGRLAGETARTLDGGDDDGAGGQEGKCSHSAFLSHSRQVMLKRCSERASSPSSLARCCCCCSRSASLSHGCRHRASARGQRRVRGEERRRANAVRLCELLPPLRLSPDSLAPSTAAAAAAAGARCCCAAADAQLQPDRRRFTHDSSSSRSDRSRRSERSGGSSSSACPSPSGTRTPSLLPFDPSSRLL